jgi:hypothetical protein
MGFLPLPHPNDMCMVVLLRTLVTYFRMTGNVHQCGARKVSWIRFEGKAISWSMRYGLTVKEEGVQRPCRWRQSLPNPHCEPELVRTY